VPSFIPFGVPSKMPHACGIFLYCGIHDGGSTLVRVPLAFD
jgi:hypothetical protein